VNPVSAQTILHVLRRGAAARILIATLTVLWISLLASQCLQSQQLSDRGAVELQTMLNVAKLAALGDDRLVTFVGHAQQAYDSKNHHLLWVKRGQFTPQAREVLDRLEHADEKGLDPQDYDGRFGEFRFAPPEIPGHPSESDLIRLDISLTLAVMQYLFDVHRGRANPKPMAFVVEIGGTSLDLPSFVTQELVEARDPRAAMEAVEPQFLGYRRTLSALQCYQNFLRQDSGAPLPDSAKPVEPGKQYPDAPRLRDLLLLLGDLPEARSPVAPDIYDTELSKAVERFQERHGLEPNGRLDSATLRELNTPIAQRVRQIELTLERWRWLPSRFTREPIVVNVPEFRLHIVDEQHHIVSSMNVVVGRAFRHETPLFESEIDSVLFRPPWNVPLNIQRNELLPLIEKNPAYLAENSYEIVDAHGNPVQGPELGKETLTQLKEGRLFLRQQPGEQNSLGLIKFDLPNPYDVYLHGTPTQELFSRSRRDFSHGCVRVEDPVALAVWLLRENPGWNEERILTAMHGSETMRIVLAHPVPIWTVYGTAVVLEDGRVRFFPDIYGEDAALEKELAHTGNETASSQ